MEKREPLHLSDAGTEVGDAGKSHMEGRGTLGKEEGIIESTLRLSPESKGTSGQPWSDFTELGILGKQTMLSHSRKSDCSYCFSIAQESPDPLDNDSLSR